MDRHALLRARRGRLMLLYIVCCVPFIGYGAWRALQTNSNSPLTWVPATFPPRADYDRFVERFGTGEVVVASWPGCTVDEPKLDDLLKTLREDAAFADSEGKRYFERITCGREIVQRLASGRFPIRRERVIDRFRGSLIGHDGRQTCIVVAFTTAGLENRDSLITEMVNRIRSRFAVADGDVHLAGPVIDGWSVDRAGQESLSQLALPSAGIMLLLAFLCLGSMRDAFIVFGLSVLCQGITLSLLYFSGTSMNALLIVLPPLIQVLAIAGGVHLTNYYLDSLPEHGRDEAPWRAVRMGWLPCLLSSGTTALGIGSLMTSRLTPIQTFGVFGSAGVMLVFGALMMVVPAVWHLCPRRFATGDLHSACGKERKDLPATMTNWIARRWPLVLALAGGSMAGCGYFLKDLNASVRIETLFRQDSRVLRDYRWLEEHIGPMVTIDVVVSWPENSRTPITQRLTELWEIQRSIGSVDDVDGSVSALQLLPAVSPSMRVSPNRNDQVLDRYLNNTRPAFISAGFLSEDGARQSWRISARVSATSQVDYQDVLNQLRDAVEPKVAAASDARDIKVNYTGVMPLVHEVQRQLMRDLLHSFLGALAVIAIVMTLAQGGLVAGVIAMIPNVFPIVLMFGVLGWWRLPVDIGTVMTASVALGIAVDDTLHFLTFFQQANRDGRSRRESVRFAYRRCAKAMIQTSVICGFGLLVFALAEFLPTSRFAWFLSIMILLALLGDLCVLPAILLSPLGRFLALDNDSASETSGHSPRAPEEDLVNEQPHEASGPPALTRQ